MMTRKGMSFSAGRNAALVATAALALTAFTPVTGAKAETTIPAARMETPNATATDFSAARRHRAVRHHRHYRRGGNAAAAAAFAGIIGTVGAIAASQARRDYYYDRGYGYYGGGPYYYGRPYGGYYGPGYYGY